MYNPALPRYCQRMAQCIDGVEIDSVSFGALMELDFSSTESNTKFKELPNHLEGTTFKNKDTLSSSKLRELETLLTSPWLNLLDYVEIVQKRYAPLASNSIQLNAKEEFFALAEDKAVAFALGNATRANWAHQYPILTLSSKANAQSPKHWISIHAVFVSLVEFMVRELSLSSAVPVWSAPT